MSYVSPIDCLVIDDANAHEQTKGVIVSGEEMVFGWAPPPEDFSATFAAPFPTPLIPRSEWDERIRDQVRFGMNPIAVARGAGLTVKNQKRTNYCWEFSKVQLVEFARVKQGLEHVPLSPASVAAPLTQYRNARGNPAGVGGWASKGVDFASINGICPSSIWPEHGIDSKYDTPTARAARQLYKPTEWWNLPTGDFAAVMTSLLLGEPVAIGLGWWGHQVVAMDPVKFDGTGNYGVKIWNPWGPDWPKPGAGGEAILTESKARPNDAVTVGVVTAS